MKQLSKTVDMMNSEEFGDRLIAEYAQARIRYEKIGNYLQNCNNDCSSDYHDLLVEQVCIMGAYIVVLIKRLKSLGILSEAYEFLEETNEEE